MESPRAGADAASGRSVFFDLDGTLADSLPGLQASLELAAASCGRRFQAEDLRPYIGPGVRVILRNLLGEVSETELDAMERSFRASYDTEGVRRTTLFAGVKETLARLREDGAALYLVTNKPVLATATLFEQHGLAPFFRERLSRNSRQPSYASKGEMLLDLMERHRIRAQDAAMVGDTREDYEAAMQAGVAFIFASYGYGTLEEALDGTVRCARIAEPAALAALLAPAAHALAGERRER